MLAIEKAIKKLAEKENLEFQTMQKVTAEIVEGKAPEVLIGGLLVGLATKGETVEEISAVSETLLEYSKPVNLPGSQLLDTCGTGGDHSRTFNISTAAAFVCAACGVPVAKHGNRSQSSVSGSADVLKALGAKVDLNPQEAMKVFEKTGITFLFAPIYHPALKHAASVRQMLKIRTIFNLVGPIVNPARAGYRILGVSSYEHLPKVAEVLKRLGVQKAFVYHSESGLDEIALDSENHVIEVENGETREFALSHKDFGLSRVSRSEIVVNSPEESAQAIINAFKGFKGPHFEYIVANAAAGIYVAGAAKTLRGAVEKARKAIESGEALRKLEEFIKETGGQVVFS